MRREYWTCDRCGEEYEPTSSKDFEKCLKYVEQAENERVRVVVLYSHHQNGGKNIPNGDLCQKCRRELLLLVADDVREAE